jgi:hypothetical protein
VVTVVAEADSTAVEVVSTAAASEAEAIAEADLVATTADMEAIEGRADITVMVVSAARREASAAARSVAWADIPGWDAGLPVEGRGWVIERQLTPASLTDVGMALEAD